MLEGVPPLGPRRALGDQAGRGDLAQLVERRGGAAPGRIAVLLQLDGQGASALEPHRQAQRAAGVERTRLGQAQPVHGRVAPLVGGLDGAAVLHEEERPYQERRHVLEAGEPRGAAGARIVQAHMAGVADHQPRGPGLWVGRIDAPAQQLLDPGCLAGLGRDLPALAAEMVEDLGKARVAATLVEGARARERDARAGPRLDGVGQTRRPARERPRLERRGPSPPRSAASATTESPAMTRRRARPAAGRGGRRGGRIPESGTRRVGHRRTGRPIRRVPPPP